MSESNKEQSTSSLTGEYNFRFYVRLHLCWILAIIAIFLGQAWWLIPLPGDSLLPPYRTYPASVLKAFFEGLAAILAARSLVVALIKVFTNGIYPDSVIRFQSAGGVEAIYSGIRYRSGFRYIIIASLIPVACLLGNLLQAEFQSSTTIFYHLEESSLSMNAAQCQHTTESQYNLASTAYSKGMISNSLSDASSIISGFNQSTTTSPSNFGVSLISANFTPVSNISVQAPHQSIFTKRHHEPCHDEDDGTASGNTADSSSNSTASTNGQSNNSSGSITPPAGQTPTVSANVPSSSAINGTPASASITTNDGNGSSNNSNLASNSQNQRDSNATTASMTASQQQQQQSNTTLIYIDGEPIISLATQLQYLQTLKRIPLSSTVFNGSADLYVLRHTSAKHGEAIIIVSNPPDAVKPAGFYITARSTNYTCFSGTVQQCSEHSAVTSNADNKVVADAVAEAMRSNVGLYGSTGMVSDVLNGHYQNDTKLVDALFTNPLCSDYDTYPVKGNVIYPYTRATWSILAIIWAILLIIIWAIGAYLIGYTIEVFCHLTQYGNLLPQIISNSAIFVDEQRGEVVKQEMFLNWEKVELIAHKESSVEIEVDPPQAEEQQHTHDHPDHDHGYVVTTEELPA
ncbi:uncharacterized protein RHIMIDRAFT_296677 [Rhizopus microsporus ATCC 52813]|uniref:Uncharacterized protein n=1 Tax=Rhizopus microsporus ATCC 52813 TaxID=1340429 RepID=A0A2G4T8M3_RHIZD|nr:uncharacterized protein RHIMIDRAFT_296677 [Rhizopus microsporus ATCC 52813]PHZ17374.1 hypothetical protein RHIMIDRAFT_296677 [Rhizopus microsporus ATCC 52813]